MLVISDTHIGVQRTGGTTPTSARLLRDYVRDQFQKLLDLEDQEVTINGDLFDGFTVDTAEVIHTYEIMANWLDNGIRTLNLIQGNHDANPRGEKVSSFHLLCHFLKSRFGDKVRVFDNGFACVDGDRVFCIPHVPNQAIFDLEIDKAVSMPGEGKYLLLHCNCKNTFAEHSDHSLNLGDKQVGDLMRAGWTLVLGHEHCGYKLRNGRVVVVGNQFPTSVSDCIGEKTKYALRIMTGGYDLIPTWQATGNYVEVDWRNLDIGNADFVRVTGDAHAAESAEVVKAISTLRQRVNCYVITNAVRIEGHDMAGEEAAASVESLRAFDVLGALLAELDEKEAEVVRRLLNE